MRHTARFILSGIAIATFALPLAASAESVSWSSPTQPNLIAIGRDGPDLSTIHLNHPVATITYGVTVWKLDSAGAKVSAIPSGSAIPVGTRVLLEFKAHQYSDIYWFGAGSVNDSPYGDWVAGAANPIPNSSGVRSGLCLSKNQYLTNVKSGDSISNAYAALSVAPPAKSITLGGVAATCTKKSDGYDLDCVLSTPGAVTATFAFAQTKGDFYAAQKRSKGGNSAGKCQSDGDPMAISGGDRKTAGSYQLTVPRQTIPFTLNVTDTSGTPPGAPTVSGGGGGSGTSVSGASSCTTGVPYTITMNAADPNADTIRYGVDWDGNGIVDQFVPATGYVPSGTPETVSRTFATDGAKSIKVFAQNSHGFISPWTSYAVTCAAAQTASATSTAIMTGDDGNDSGAGGSISPALNLRAIPSLVSPGKSSTINWSATNVLSCAVSGDNGDAWTGTVSPLGGETSAPITAKTVYTLSCKTKAGAALTAKAVVNILPTWIEQ